MLFPTEAMDINKCYFSECCKPKYIKLMLGFVNYNMS